MKFGLFGGAVIKPNTDSGDSLGYKPFMDIVSKAEDLGFESMSLVEHHFGGDGQISSSLSLLSHLAAITSKLRLGTAVTVLPWHNPILLAEQVATIDVLSGGRVDFGVGKGYRKNEYKGFNIPQNQALTRYLESIEIIKKAWTSRERFNFEGKFWSFEDIIVEPAPVQSPHPPLWSAAGSDESIRDVAKAGFKVLFDHFATFDRTQQRLDAWREACNKIGRTFDP
ncbi:MAG: Alkanal monooxygenase beta chain, partial [Alphaproteobacteria bacterium MarineAlpha3_Bin7]